MVGNNHSNILQSMEDKRFLFEMTTSSSVDETAEDNLERRSWLASNPPLHKFMNTLKVI